MRTYGPVVLVMMFCLLMGGGLALAEEDSNTPREKTAVKLEAVMVTADKTTSKNVDELPISVSVMSGEELEDYDVSYVDQLTNFLPNVNSQKMGSHWTEVSFRGMGAMTNMFYTSYSSLDGVALPYVGSDAFFDVKRIEVVRGGVGSLFGRNTHAGHINIISNDPGDTLNGQVRARYGTYNTYDVSAAVGGPVSDQVSFRLAAKYTGTDGWVENDYYGRDDTNDGTQASGRGKIVFSPSDTCDLTLSLNVDRFDSANDNFTTVDDSGNVHTLNDLLGHDNGTMFSPILRVEKSFGSLALTSITAYVDTTYDTLLDQDMSSLDIVALDYQEEYQTISQELRLATADPDAAWQWVGGIYLMHQKTSYSTKFDYRSQAAMWGAMPGMYQKSTADLTTDNAALFGQVQFRPWSKVELTAAVRLDWERTKVDWVGTSGLGGTTYSTERFDGEQDWLAFLPRVSAAYLLTPEQRIYATIYQGYRSGAYDVISFSREVVASAVDPEYTTTYEVGYKASLMDKRLSLRTAIFYVDWRDIQLSAVKDTVETLQNAGAAHSYGLEAEVNWLVMPGLHVLASLGLISAELDEYDDHPSGEDLAGNTIPNTPKYKFTLGGVYRHDSGIFAQASASWIGKKYLDEINGYEQDAVVLINAKLGYEAEHWAAYLWGENLADELYVVRAGNYFSTGYYGRTAQPLAVGLELTLRF